MVEDPWPWQPAPRRPRPELAGDLQGAIDFGLAVSLDELADVTALICSGIPSAIECRATWSRDGSKSCSIEIDNSSVKYSQSFISTENGLAVDQGLFVLAESLQDRGYAKRLFRNLVLLYDRLGVRHASVYADHTVGAYTWAKLGAQPIDPSLQRSELMARLAKQSTAWGITAAERLNVETFLRTVSDTDLVHRTACLTCAGGLHVGKKLLLGHQWDGFWDLQDASLRRLLRETIA